MPALLHKRDSNPACRAAGRIFGLTRSAVTDYGNYQSMNPPQNMEGEELIGSILEELGADFLVFHDLSSPYGNIDHLVLSKRTGLFLIETKAHGGRVNVVNGELQVNQRPPEKDFIAQAVRNTAWLSEQLEVKLSTKIWIEPILVFANAYVERCEPIRNVQIVPKIYLLRTIRRARNFSRSSGLL